MFHTCRDYGSIVILRQFLITAIQYRLVTIVFGHTGLEVVRNQKPRYTVEVFVCVDMTVQPVLQPHVGCCFRIDVTATRQNSNEQIGRRDFTGHGVVDRKRIACPIDLHGISRFVLDTHRCLGDSRPRTVFVTKLRGHIRLLAKGFCFLNILIPQQCQRDTALRELSVDVGVVRFQICAGFRMPFREEDGSDLFIGHGFFEWPYYSVSFCSRKCVPYCMTGAVYTRFNLPLAVAFVAQP